MTNPKTLIKSTLDAGLGALVPVSRILSTWPTSFTEVPQVNFNILDNFTTTQDIFDNRPIADNILVEIHLWNKPGKSLTDIFVALVNCMESAEWNRESYVELVDPDTKLMHVVTRWAQTVYR
jgi:hypothetical protein